MTQQPEALRLADELDGTVKTGYWEAAAELRRLYAMNKQLLEALEGLESWATDVRRDDPAADLAKARAALAAAKE
jgi:hypothetical protein